MFGAPSGIGLYGNGDERRATSTNPHAPTTDVPREEMIRTVRANLESLDTAADIRTLDLRNRSLDDAMAAVVAEELTDPGNDAGQLVTRIDLRGNKIGDRGAAALAALPAAIGSLTEVLLSRNRVGDAGGAALASGLAGNETLKLLNLNDNAVGDGGCEAFAECLRTNTGLTKLLLEGNEITDAGVVVLAAVLQPSEGGDAAAAAGADGEGGGPSAPNISLEQLPLGRNSKIADTVRARSLGMMRLDRTASLCSR